jgi:hypothetical protein
MAGMIAMFGVIAVVIFIMGIWQGRIEAMVGGLAYLAIALAGWRRKAAPANTTEVQGENNEA